MRSARSAMCVWTESIRSLSIPVLFLCFDNINIYILCAHSWLSLNSCFACGKIGHFKEIQFFFPNKHQQTGFWVEREKWVETNYLEIKLISVQKWMSCKRIEQCLKLVSISSQLMCALFVRWTTLMWWILEMFHFLFAPFKVLIFRTCNGQNGWHSNVVTVNSLLNKNALMANKNRQVSITFFCSLIWLKPNCISIESDIFFAISSIIGYVQ